MAFHMPKEYPTGGPLFWMHEETGVMRALVVKWFQQEERLTADEFRILKEYIAHWIQAPCFMGLDGRHPELLQALAGAAGEAGIRRVLDALEGIGIDPF